MPFAILIISYLIGSIPIAWFLTRLVTGKDLRQMGSGNVGVMNVAVSVHRWAGLLVFLGEASKGIAAVAIAVRLDGSDLAISLAVLGAVIGTRWSVWLRGAGGRGNTAGGAALLLISWQALASTLMVWFLLRWSTKSSFLATRLSLIAFPVILGLFTQSGVYLIAGALLALIYISTQAPETDDHIRIKRKWPSLWAFLTAAPRKRELSTESSADESMADDPSASELAQQSKQPGQELN